MIVGGARGAGCFDRRRFRGAGSSGCHLHAVVPARDGRPRLRVAAARCLLPFGEVATLVAPPLLMDAVVLARDGRPRSRAAATSAGGERTTVGDARGVTLAAQHAVVLALDGRLTVARG